MEVTKGDITWEFSLQLIWAPPVIHGDMGGLLLAGPYINPRKPGCFLEPSYRKKCVWGAGALYFEVHNFGRPRVPRLLLWAFRTPQALHGVNRRLNPLIYYMKDSKGPCSCIAHT